MPAVSIDYIHGGKAHGDVADRLIESGGDVRQLRPYLGKDGRSYITANSRDNRGKEVQVAQLTDNAATLRREEWARMDQTLINARRLRLRAYSDLRKSSEYGGFDGFATLMLENEVVDDGGEAHVDFDGLTEGTGSAPVFDLEGLPLPIIHSPFSFSARRIAVSRKLGTPLPTVQAERATRRVMETVERMTIGTLTTRAFNPADRTYRRTPRVYGYSNHPDRMTDTITASTAPGWTPKTLLNEVLDAISALQDDGFDGPFMVYHGKGWTSAMGSDYSDAKGDHTLRDRLRDVEEIQDVRKLNYMGNDNRILIVQMTEDVAQAVNGMEFSMVQWDTKGGMQKNFRVMGIQVPRIRSDSSNRTGIWDAVPA